MTRRLAVAFAAAAAVSGCSDPAADRAEVSFALAAPADVLQIRLEIQPANLVVDIPITQAAPTIFRNVTVPVGRQTVTATAFAGPDLQSLVRIGSATATIDVAAGATATVSLTILDERGPGGPGDRAPIITGLVAPAALTSGASAAVSATATDLDGDPIAWAWTAAPAGCGSFADPAAAATTFTAGAAGDCVVTATATAGGKSDSASRTVAVAAVTGGVGVTGQFIERPQIASVTVGGGGLGSGVAVTDRAAANVGPPLEGGTAVTVEVAWPPLPVPVTVRLADTCTATTYQPLARTPGAALDAATFGWTLPSPPFATSQACGLTATVTVTDHPSLSDAFAVAVEVGPPACAVAAPVLSVALGPQGPIGSTGSPPLLTWNDVAGETGYEIARGLFGVIDFQPFATAPQDATSYLDGALIAPAAGAYCYGCAYAVRAVAPPCVSAWSNVAIAPSAPPAGPAGPPSPPGVPPPFPAPGGGPI